jgi:hypothetical protein
MKGYVIRTEETKSIKKAAKKFGTHTVKTEDLDGVIEIRNYRKYPYYEEVDVVFKGKIHAIINGETSWWEINDSQVLYISQAAITNFFKKVIFDPVRTRMNFFGVDLKHRSSIKTVKWDS